MSGANSRCCRPCAQIVRPYSSLCRTSCCATPEKPEGRGAPTDTDQIEDRRVPSDRAPPAWSRGVGLRRRTTTEPVLFYGFVKREKMLKQRAGFEYGHDAFNRQPSTSDGGRVRLSDTTAAASGARRRRGGPPDRPTSTRQQDAGAPRENGVGDGRVARRQPAATHAAAAGGAGAIRTRGRGGDAAHTRAKGWHVATAEGRRGSAQAAGRSIDSAKSAAYAELEEKLGAKPSIAQMLAWNERQFDLADEPEGAGLLEWINEGNGSGPTITDWTRWAQPPVMWFDGGPRCRVVCRRLGAVAAQRAMGPDVRQALCRWAPRPHDRPSLLGFVLELARQRRLQPHSSVCAAGVAAVERGPGPADGANRWRARPEDELEYKKRLFDWVVPFELGLLYPATSGNAPDGTSGLLPHLPLRGEAPLRGWRSRRRLCSRCRTPTAQGRPGKAQPASAAAAVHGWQRPARRRRARPAPRARSALARGQGAN